MITNDLTEPPNRLSSRFQRNRGLRADRNVGDLHASCWPPVVRL